MRCIVFDTSTIISIATNNLLTILGPLRKKYGGKFCVPSSVKEELIDRPMHSKKFKFEAIQLLAEIEKGNLSLENESKEEVTKLLRIANSIYKAHGNYISILHWGEVGTLVLAKKIKADAVAIDERTTRVLIESPETLARILGKKTHTPVSIDKANLAQFLKYIGGLTILRSSELILIAYKLGLLDSYLPKKGNKLNGLNATKELLDGLLWGLKLRGCSINSEEIDDILKLKKL